MKKQANHSVDGMKAVLYCRFSSSSQNEQSIERQQQVCRQYAVNNGIEIVGEYIDRAASATTDNRMEFQKMLTDSARQQFQAVLVYSLDRFGRNVNQDMQNQIILAKNNVIVLSATEAFTADSSGVFLKNILMCVSQLYSDELREKVTRGKELSARKLQFTGGTVPFGYKSIDKKLVLDEDKAPYVLKIFEMYSSGSRVTDICNYLNERGIKTAKGSVFNKNSIRYLAQNPIYIGKYVYKGEVLSADAIPRIVSDEMFYTVGDILTRNRQAPARLKAKEEYILTPKLFCGCCKERGHEHILMTGYSGYGKVGKLHHYYACVDARGSKKKCTKKNVRKAYIEDLVIQQCLAVLTDENIERIAKEIVAISEKTATNYELKRLQKLLKENAVATENLLKAIESGQAIDALLPRLQLKTDEKAELEKQIEQEKAGRVELSTDDIMFFLNSLRYGDINDLEYRRMLVTVLVNRVYLYDNKLVCIFNAESRPVTVTADLLDEIESSTGAGSGGSCLRGCTALHCTALHCTALHCTAVQCSAVQCSAPQLNNPR